MSIFAQADDSDLVIQSEGMKIKVEKVAHGFSVPWAIAVLSSNELLITEREGRVHLYYLVNQNHYH